MTRKNRHRQAGHKILWFSIRNDGCKIAPIFKPAGATMSTPFRTPSRPSPNLGLRMACVHLLSLVGVSK